MFSSKSLIAVMLILSAAAKDRPDERLKDVVTIFVAGNNQAAEGARQVLRSGKTCLTLATKGEDADAVIDIAADAQSQGGVFGGLGGRSWVVSGVLTLRSKDQVWSRSERFSDAPMKSGAKTAGGLLMRHLAKDAGCSEREKTN